MILYFNIMATKKDGGLFNKQVEYTSKARTSNSKIIDKELRAWASDNIRYWELDTFKYISYGWDINKKPYFNN